VVDISGETTDRKTATPSEMRDLVASLRTDDPSWFQFDGGRVSPKDLAIMLTPHVSETRRANIEAVLDRRTENVAVVVEGMVDLGNVSAVMRTADGFGVQKVHAIDTATKYKRSKRITQGADKWVDRYRWESTKECFDQLRKDGYRIVAADVGDGAAPAWDTDLTRRCALVFGNELEGLTTEARHGADEVITVPMGGFTESFNISVAAAVVLYEVMGQRRKRNASQGDLSVEARDRIRAVWYAKSVSNVRALVEHKLANDQPSNGTR
jgi:tRNA (guanosine-2'-O-)-methyltransferase